MCFCVSDFWMCSYSYSLRTDKIVERMGNVVQKLRKWIIDCDVKKHLLTVTLWNFCRGHGGVIYDRIGESAYLSKFQVVDIPLEVVGYGGNHAGFSGACRSIQQVATLPWPSDSLKIVLARHKSVEVGFDGPQLRRLHSQCVEGGWMLEVHRLPKVPARGECRLIVRVQEHFSAENLSSINSIASEENAIKKAVGTWLTCFCAESCTHYHVSHPGTQE